MAASSSTVTPRFIFGFLPPANEKLTRSNYSMWYAQVLSTLKGAQLFEYTLPMAAPPVEFTEGALDPATGKRGDPVPNPDHAKWVSRDQIVLSYLFSSLSKEVFAQVSSSKTAAELWSAIQDHHASQARARVISTRMALASASKGSSTVAEYFVKMKNLADEMASAGRKLEDEELVSYILNGLGDDFDGPVSAISTRVEPITVAECYAQRMAYEQRKEMHGGGSQSSVNTVTKGGRGGGNYSNNNFRVRRGRGGPGRSNGGRDHGKNFLAGVFCQICGIEGHMAPHCYNRYDERYTGPPQHQQKSASSTTTSSYGVDTNWYMDSGTTDHITSELDKLTIHDKYYGNDHVHAANGSGMDISHVGHSTLQSPHHKIHLRNILHVPSSNKSLVSINRLTRDNDAFVEFHPTHFCIKERATKKTLLGGRSEGGLYPLKPLQHPDFEHKQAHGIVKPTVSVWHHRLGHLSATSSTSP
jgi:hypothetical protein